MYNSKLLQVFGGLTGGDKRALHKFLRSPFFNHREEVIVLWDYIVKSKLGGELDLGKSVVYQTVFPNQEYQESQLRHVMSWLLKCIEEYLAYQQYRKQRVFPQLYLAEAYRHLNLDKHFNQTIKNTRNQLDQMVMGQDYLHAEYLLEMELYAYAESRRRTTSNNLQKVSKVLDLRIISGKLRQSCLLLAHQAVFKTDYDYTFLPELLKYLEHSEYLTNPSIGMYYYCYRALTENDTEYFKRFKAELLKNQNHFALDELRDCFLMAINYCIKQMNKGLVEYQREAFELFQSALGLDILLIDGYISRFSYTNIVASAVKLEEYQWLDQFIEDYKPLLEPRYRDNYYNYNRARYYVALKEYSRAMPLLVAIDEKDLLVSLDARKMLVKMYYELGELESLEFLLNSIQTFISRKKIMGYHRAHYLGTAQFTRKLLYLSPSDRAGIQKIRQEIMEAEILPDRDWLLAQLDTF